MAGNGGPPSGPARPTARRRTAPATAALLATIVLAVAAGCGSDGDGATTAGGQPAPTAPATAPTGPAALTADAYRTQADAQCTELRGEVLALDMPSGEEELEAYLDRLLPVIDRYARRFGALAAPRQLAAGHAVALALITRSLESLRAVQAAIRAGADPGDTFRAARPMLDALDERAEVVLRGLGLTVCGQGDEG